MSLTKVNKYKCNLDLGYILYQFILINFIMSIILVGVYKIIFYLYGVLLTKSYLFCNLSTMYAPG